MRRLILTVTCPDRTGIVAAVTGFIASHGGWVVEAAQHGDLDDRPVLPAHRGAGREPALRTRGVPRRFAEVAGEYGLDWHLQRHGRAKRVVLLVSREDHCLADLLYRWRSGDLECDIPRSSRTTRICAPLVEWHGIEFLHVPVPPGDKGAAFDEIVSHFEAARADVMVLARYMQILPPEVCERYAGRIINIHHSFLPSFAGARPYHQAFERGVKLIGATCHYVTADLDAGPIIEQDTRRIDHGDTVEDLLRIGRDIERSVLARGLRWHLEDRVLINGDRTVVFAH